MYKENGKIQIWYLLLVAFIQFPIKITGNFIYLSYVYVYILPLLYLFVNCKFVLEIAKQNRTMDMQLFKLLYGLLIFMSAIWPIICKTYDFSYMTTYWADTFLWVIKYLFLIIVFLKKIPSDNLMEDYTKYFVGGVSLYTVISLISLLIEPIRNAMFKIIYITKQDLINYQRAEYRTRFGWTGWSSFNETMVCTFAIILLCILILKNNDHFEKQKKYMLQMVLPLVGNAMYGRIGLMASLICILLTCFAVFMKGNIRYIFRILFISGIVFAIFMILKDKISIFKDWYEWIFSAFVNYQKTGKFYDNMGTVQHLTQDMYWMPSKSTFMWGDGMYTDSAGQYYMHTDSGIMRPILYFGVFNYGISIIAVIFLLHKFSRCMMKSRGAKNTIILFIILIVCVGVFEFKGESLWMFVGLTFPVIMLNTNLKTNRR